MYYIATFHAQVNHDGTMEGLEVLETAKIELPEWDNFDPENRIEDLNNLGWIKKYDENVEFFVTYARVEPLVGFARTIKFDEDGVPSY